MDYEIRQEFIYNYHFISMCDLEKRVFGASRDINMRPYILSHVLS